MRLRGNTKGRVERRKEKKNEKKKKSNNKTRLRLETMYLQRVSIEMTFGRFILKIDSAERSEEILIERNAENDIA